MTYHVSLSLCDCWMSGIMKLYLCSKELLEGVYQRKIVLNILKTYSFGELAAK